MPAQEQCAFSGVWRGLPPSSMARIERSLPIDAYVKCITLNCAYSGYKRRSSAPCSGAWRGLPPSGMARVERSFPIGTHVDLLIQPCILSTPVQEQCAFSGAWRGLPPSGISLNAACRSLSSAPT